MKRILILALFIGFNTFAEDHGSAATSVGRPAVDPQQQLNRLNELISACSPGRPGGAGDVGGGAGGPGQVFIPPVTTIPPSTLPPSTEDTVPPSEGGNSSNGAFIYQTRCVSRHGDQKGAPALAGLGKASKIAAVQSGTMPQKGSLSPTEKTDLLAYLNTLSQ